MPEAAEVTVAAAQLGAIAVGRTVGRLTVTHPRTSRAQPAGELERFAGARIAGVRRHGKWLLVTLDETGAGAELGIHLRMSGQLLARRPGDEPDDRHVHAVFELGERSVPAGSADGVPAPPPGAAGTGAEPFELWFRDPRTFGELRALPSGAPVAADLFDPTVTAGALEDVARTRRVGVKAVLLDQLRSVSGIGSYLADEALHRASISPLVPAGEIATSAWQRILEAARDITVDSAAAGGVSLPDEGWVDLWGRLGRYAPELRVHGLPRCATCGTETRRAVVGGRSARWCPSCQPARRRR